MTATSPLSATPIEVILPGLVSPDDKILSTKSEFIKNPSKLKKNKKFIEKLNSVINIGLMHQAQGLAANQTGLKESFFVIFGKPGNAEVYINPIVQPHKMAKIERKIEECLTCNQKVEVARWTRVLVEADILGNGKRGWFDVQGNQARIIQHEYDHLQGIKITDYLGK